MLAAKGNSKLLREANLARRRGWILVPCRGKRPVFRNWTEAPIPTAEDVKKWVNAGYNIGVVTGSRSGVIGIDDDSEEQNASKILNLPEGPRSETGGGGTHYLFLAPATPIRNSVGKIAPKVDVRGEGGLLLLPGSIHPDTGKDYRWKAGFSPEDKPLRDVPDPLLGKIGAAPASTPRVIASISPISSDAAAAQAGMALNRLTSMVYTAKEGTRNDTLNRAAYTLGGFLGRGLTYDQAYDALFEAATDRVDGIPPDEAADVIERGLRDGSLRPIDPPSDGITSTGSLPLPAPRSTALTDTGSAERLIQLEGDNLRFLPAWGKWVVWNGSHWELDVGGLRVLDFTLRVITAMKRDADAAEAAGNEELATSLRAWARKSESAPRRLAIEMLARSNPLITLKVEDLDVDPELFACANGTIDLRTGTLRDHERLDYITRVSPVVYDPEARCPRWMAFLEQVIPSPDVRSYVQRVVGYCLSGRTDAQALFFLLGEGSNGKSVFVSVVLELLGAGYGMTAAPDLLMARKGEAHLTELADLFCKRVVACTEVSTGGAFDEARVKALTGGDRVRARRMREDAWEFRAYFKIIIAGNHKPRIAGVDHGIWRRIHLVMFGVTIPNEKQDPRLKEKLLEELPGILNWALEGYRAYDEGGLQPPAEVLEAGATYREENDTFGAFMAEKCVQGPEAEAPSTDLYKAYSAWAIGAGERVMTQRAFSLALKERGFATRKSHGRIVFEGIAPK